MKKYIFMILVYAWGHSVLNAENFNPEEINDMAVHSEDSSLILGLTGGTLGFGLNIAHPINDFLSVRFNINKFNMNTTDKSKYSRFLIDDKKYHLDTKGILVDVNLWQLRVSGGFYLNNNSIEYTTRPNVDKEVILNGQKYGVNKIINVKSTVYTNKIAPYIGVGWGNNRSNEGWSFSLDVGLMYHGKPKIDIDLEIVEGIPTVVKNTIQKALEIEKKKQERDLLNLSVYPVIMVGMSYNF